MFLGCFWALAGQPYNHIGWATSIPFASINPTNPRPLWNFREMFFENWRFWKSQFFELAILNFFFQKKMLHSHQNQSNFMWIGWNFDVFPVSRKFLAMRNITLYSVHTCLCFYYRPHHKRRKVRQRRASHSSSSSDDDDDDQSLSPLPRVRSIEAELEFPASATILRGKRAAPNWRHQLRQQRLLHHQTNFV